MGKVYSGFTTSMRQALQEARSESPRLRNKESKLMRLAALVSLGIVLLGLLEPLPRAASQQVRPPTLAGKQGR